jgi:hypothetical protein
MMQEQINSMAGKVIVHDNSNDRLDNIQRLK